MYRSDYIRGYICFYGDGTKLFIWLIDAQALLYQILMILEEAWYPIVTGHLSVGNLNARHKLRVIFWTHHRGDINCTANCCQVWYKIWWLEHDTKRYYKILCEMRSIKHDIFETHSDINIFEYHAKNHPNLSFLCSESYISEFWPISLTDFSGTWSARNIIMLEVNGWRYFLLLKINCFIYLENYLLWCITCLTSAFPKLFIVHCKFEMRKTLW